MSSAAIKPAQRWSVVEQLTPSQWHAYSENRGTGVADYVTALADGLAIASVSKTGLIVEPFAGDPAVVMWPAP